MCGGELRTRAGTHGGHGSSEYGRAELPRGLQCIAAVCCDYLGLLTLRSCWEFHCRVGAVQPVCAVHVARVCRSAAPLTAVHSIGHRCTIVPRLLPTRRRWASHVVNRSAVGGQCTSLRDVERGSGSLRDEPCDVWLMHGALRPSNGRDMYVGACCWLLVTTQESDKGQQALWRPQQSAVEDRSSSSSDNHTSQTAKGSSNTGSTRPDRGQPRTQRTAKTNTHAQ